MHILHNTKQKLNDNKLKSLGVQISINNYITLNGALKNYHDEKVEEQLEKI